MQSTGNTLAIAGVKELVPKLEEKLPDGMTIKVAVDSSEFIGAPIKSVYKVLVEALILVVFVIFIFKKCKSHHYSCRYHTCLINWRFFLSYLMGFTINVLTLLGIVLSVGLVVDDAIVMLENIHRQIELGKVELAAIDGANEIGFAILAMTFTLVVVFMPLLFMTGRVGQLFIEFALTVAAAVLVSGFIALTLTPMMCSKLLKNKKKKLSINSSPVLKIKTYFQID